MEYNFDGFGDENNEELELYVVLQVVMQELYTLCVVAYIAIEIVLKRYIHKYPRTVIRGPNRLQEQMDHINRLVRESDITCIEQLRMDRRCFMTLCHMVRTIGGLGHSKHVTLEEKMALFLYVLAHDLKVRKLKFNFFRSGETVSRHFNDVLKAVLRLQGHLLRTPNPITQACTDPRWNCFQNCLGALDGTYIKVRVPVVYQARYRTRKGEIATNVLGVCSQDMNFIYVLPGWEGSAADSRVLRDAINRPNGLRIPTGYYYLVDAGYTNGQGFLAPYRGQRYHLSVWRAGATPTNYQEFFNMKHASARNVIERCFGEGPADAVDAINAEEELLFNSLADDGTFLEHMGISSHIGEGINCSSSSSQRPPESSAKKNDNKKRPRGNDDVVEGLSMIANKLGEVFSATNEKLDFIGRRMGYEHDLASKRASLNDELIKLPIALDERLDACEIISQSAQKLDMFFSLTHDDKLRWVMRLLRRSAP